MSDWAFVFAILLIVAFNYPDETDKMVTSLVSPFHQECTSP